jgi:hypothetical protein
MTHTTSNSPAFMAVLALTMGIVQLLGYAYVWPFWGSMLVLTLIGFWGLARLLFVPSFVTAWSVYGVSLALAYGFGTLNTMTSGYVDGSSMYLVSFAGYSALGRAEGLMLLIVAALLYIGHIDPRKTIPMEPFTDSERSTTFVLLVLMTIGTFVALATGQLGFQGVQSGNDTVLVSPLASLVTSGLTPATALAILAFGNQPKSRTRLLVIVLCLLLALTQMTQGRRLLLFNVLTLLMAFFAVRSAKGFFSTKIIVGLLVTVAVVAGASRFFVSMRIAGYDLPQDASVAERVVGAWDVITHPAQSGLNEHLQENQSTRTFVVGYVGELIEGYDKTGDSTNGDLLILNLATAMPTAIWPGKWRVIADVGSDEIACHPKMGMPPWDAANTIITEGLCDFGWTGMMLYPIGMAALMTLANLAVRRSNIVIRALVTFSTIKSLLGVEGVLAGYVVDLRNTAILAIAAAALVAMFNWYQKLPLVQYQGQQSALRKQRIAELRNGGA